MFGGTLRAKRNLLLKFILIFGISSLLWILYPGLAESGTYTSTIHGGATINSITNGVDRAAVKGSPYPDAVGAYPKGHCGHCHEQHASLNGAEPTPPTAEGATSYALFRSNFSSINSGTTNELCYACHETFSFGLGAGYGRYGIYMGKSIYNNSQHFISSNMVWNPNPVPPGPPINDAGNCINCHNPHGYNDGSGVIPSMLFKRIDKDTSDYTNRILCDMCHDGTHGTKDVRSLFIRTYKHPTYTVAGKHVEWENTTTFNSGAFGGTNRHAECVDCHNPHAATAASELKGSDGVTISSNPTNFTDLTSGNLTANADVSTSVTQPNVTTLYLDYKLCFKCHSNWAYGAAANAPNPTPSAAWQQTNMAQEFNVNNWSFHWVEGDLVGSSLSGTTYAAGCNNYGPSSTATPRASTSYGNFNATYIGIMEPSLSGATDTQIRTAKLRCSSCHGMDGKSSTTPEGPHGSANAFLLKVPSGSTYNTWSSSVSYSSNSTTIWCFNCHSNNFTNTGFSGMSQNLHTNRHNGRYCQYCHVAIPHGWKRYRLIRFGDCDSAPYNGTGASTGFLKPTGSGFNWGPSGSWSEPECHSNGVVGSCG